MSLKNGSIEVFVTDTFKINIDTLGNHHPLYLTEPKVNDTGRYAGSKSGGGWVGSGCFFKGIPQAIYWGVKNEHISSLDKPESFDIKGYTEYLEKLNKITMEYVNKVCPDCPRKPEGVFIEKDLF